MPEQDHLKVSLCASFIVEPLQDYLEYWNNEFGLNTNIAVAPYNQVFQQLLDPGSLLNQNQGINILFIRVQDWLRDQMDTPPSEQSHFLEKTYSLFTEAIQKLRKTTTTPFLIGIVPLSPSYSFSFQTATHVEEINRKLYAFLKNIPFFYPLDLIEIATLYQVEEIFDPKSDELGHIPFTQEYYAALGTYLWRKIRAYKSASYKVIALDCDNTLWKGICGEDGTLNVIIDKNYAYLQQFLLEKYKEGFLLVLCSKNNEKDVWDVFDRHPQMILKQENIAAHQINWSPKPGNLATIARDLNLGLDSFIFLDDSNFEIEQVLISCPEILSLHLPEDSDTFFSFLNHIWAFDLFQVTEEDLQRNNRYQAEKQRKQEQINYGHLNDFLHSLNIQVNLYPLEEKNIDRAVQLTLRTNQFNLNGIRKTAEEITKVIHNKEGVNWIVDVKDRFGDYGTVGLLLSKTVQDSLVIDTFLLSCRVLGRNVEDFVLAQLQKYCALYGLQLIKAQYQPTSRNKPFSEFLVRTNWLADDKTSSYCFVLKNKSQLLLNTNEA